MKHLVRIALLSLILCSARAENAEMLVFNMGFAPDSPQAQFQVRLTRLVFDQLGIRTEFVRVPAERALLNVNQGLDDGNLIRVIGLDAKYQNILPVEEKFIDYEFVVFTLDADLKITDWNSLKNSRVAIVKGWKVVEKNLRQYKSLVLVANGEELFTLLAEQKVDAVIYERLQGLALIAQKGFRGINVLAPALQKSPMYMYLNKSHVGLVPLAEKALAGVKSDGTYASLIQDIYGE